MKYKVLPVMLLAGLLSGCGNFGLQGTETVFAVGLDTMPIKYCTTDNSPSKKVDWRNATLVEETIKDHLYESGLITMWQDEPYIIRLINNDKIPRSFRASEFFRDTALLKVVYDGKAHLEPCLNAVTLAPGKVAELHLVPLKKGNYDYYETGFWIPFVGEIFTGTDVGFIYVHQAVQPAPIKIRLLVVELADEQNFQLPPMSGAISFYTSGRDRQVLYTSVLFATGIVNWFAILANPFLQFRKIVVTVPPVYAVAAARLRQQWCSVSRSLLVTALWVMPYVAVWP